MTLLLAAPIIASVESSPEDITASIVDSRSETVTLFSSFEPEQRNELASDAWRIGLRALASAYDKAQESKLEDLGRTLISEFDRQMTLHVEGQQQMISSLLTRYFDPNDGQVSTRLADFVSDEGSLARFLSGFLSPQNSILAQSMSKHVGDSSPLFRKLSSTDADGVVKQIEGQINIALESGRAELVRALDPLEQDGAVARFLRQLREELKTADQGFSQQLEVALAALDANNEESLLSRLVRETNRARESVMRAVNPDIADSPLAMMKSSLERLLNDHARSNEEKMREQREHQLSFERDVREALIRLETRRSTTQTTPRGGLDFEDSAIAVISATLRGVPCTVDRTGNTVGILPRCKVGDCVVRFTAESAFHGSATVFEAKHDASYTVTDALREIEEARKNRNASTGVFIMAKSHATADFPTFGRYGNDVLMVWDETDSASLPFLQAAILLGVGLVTRHKTVTDEGDLSALRDAEARLSAEIERLGKMEKNVDSIRRHSDSLSDELRKGQSALSLVVRNAQSTLRALSAEVSDERAERASPILLAAQANSKKLGPRDLQDLGNEQ
jgi:hypothetical protein